MKTAHLKEAFEQTLEVLPKKISENKKGASKLNVTKKKSVNKKMKSNIQYTCQLCESFKTGKKISLEIHCRKTHLTCLICCKKFKDYSEVQCHLENHENHVKYQKSARKSKNESKEVGSIFENHAKKSRQTVAVEPLKRSAKKSQNQSKEVEASKKPEKELLCASSSKVTSKRKEGRWSLKPPKQSAKESKNQSKVVENILDKSEKKLQCFKFTTKSKICIENLAKKSHQTVAVEPTKNLAKKSKNQCKLFETSEIPEKKLQCESCKFATNSKALLENHIKKSHKTKRAYKCKYCDFVTDINILRENHVKEVHPKVQGSSQTSIDHAPISNECENIKIEPDIDLDLFDVDMKDDFM